eukprot:TRINITY_DN50885_c0_g1_i1.p1 TRINITY_DN50885_c0_g1~~TRINITY_DN50885_c0_g1_i1.p1  ORF type:complete len:261 (-),score=102.28 TRINITY_DN50885_c0_g1_i1:99-881(-)
MAWSESGSDDDWEKLDDLGDEFNFSDSDDDTPKWAAEDEEEDDDNDKLKSTVESKPKNPNKKKGFSAKKNKKKIIRLKKQNTEDEEEPDNEDPLAKKKRLEMLQKKADIQNARDLFGDIEEIIHDEDEVEDENLIDDNKDLFGGIDESDLEDITTSVDMLNFKPKTKEEFEHYADLVSQELTTYEDDENYVKLLKDILEKSVFILNSHEIQDLIKTLNIEKNKKIQKERTKKKKKHKVIKVQEYSDEEDNFIDDEYDSYL